MEISGLTIHPVTAILLLLLLLLLAPSLIHFLLIVLRLFLFLFPLFVFLFPFSASPHITLLPIRVDKVISGICNSWGVFAICTSCLLSQALHALKSEPTQLKGALQLSVSSSLTPFTFVVQRAKSVRR